MKVILKNSDDEGSKQKTHSDLGTDGGDVSEPARIRRAFLLGSVIDKIIRDYHVYFLPIVSSIIWLIFVSVKY